MSRGIELVRSQSCQGKVKYYDRGIVYLDINQPNLQPVTQEFV
jgi:hypothetical protein